MSLPLATEPIPLSTDSDGVVRVAGTRVTLDTVVAAFRAGETSEEIAQNYPPLELADIYAVLTYYLRHQREVDSYLQRRQEVASRIRRENESRSPGKDLRQNLLARLRPRQS